MNIFRTSSKNYFSFSLRTTNFLDIWYVIENHGWSARCIDTIPQKFLNNMYVICMWYIWNIWYVYEQYVCDNSVTDFTIILFYLSLNKEIYCIGLPRQEAKITLFHDFLFYILIVSGYPYITFYSCCTLFENASTSLTWKTLSLL